MSSPVSLIVQDSSDLTVPIYSNISYSSYRSVTNVATSDLLPVILLGDPVTAGGYGGKFNSLLVSCLIYFTRSVSDIALVSFSNPCQQKHPLLFWIYLGLILLNCSNIFFYIIDLFQNHICHKCCNI